MRRSLAGLVSLVDIPFNPQTAGTTDSTMDKSAKGKKAILLVVFGTSYKRSQAAYENVLSIYRKRFPDAHIRIAFTSDYIRRKLLKRDNISIDNPFTALAHLKDEGYDDVVVQSLHMIAGEEFHDLANIVDSIGKIKGKFGFKNLGLGKPLLSTLKDYQDVSSAISNEFNSCTSGLDGKPKPSPRDQKDMAVVLMGHGTNHAANSAYSQMAYVLEADHKNVFMGTVEGYPCFDTVLSELKGSNVKKVRLIPFMIVAGDHALNDLVGNDPKSWKGMLEKEGFQIDFNLMGMGENDDVVKIFVEHTKEVFMKFV